MANNRNAKVKRGASGTSAPRRVGNPGVFQGRRRELLLEHKQEYLALKDNPHKAPAFWKRLFSAYFGEFPYHLSNFGPHLVLAPDILEKLDKDMRDDAMVSGIKQLKTFFYNLRTKASTVTANLWRDILLKALKDAQPKPRREIDFHVYMREHREEIAAEAKTRWEALSEEEREATPELVIRVRVAKEWLEDETDEVKKHINDLIESSFAERMAEYEKQREVGSDDVELDLEDTQRYHDNFASVIEPLLEQIVKLAGYTGASLIAAAPPRTEDGDFDTVAYHVGQTSREHGSLKFDEWQKDKYEELWVRHYLSWNILTSRKPSAGEEISCHDEGGDEIGAGSATRRRPTAPAIRGHGDNDVAGDGSSTTTLSSNTIDPPPTVQPTASALAFATSSAHTRTPTPTSNPAPLQAATSASAPAPPASRPRRRPASRRSSTKRGMKAKAAVDIDADELSDRESDEEDAPMMDELSDTSDGGDQREEGAHEKEGKDGEMDIPERDAKGRTLSTFLVARLKRMPKDERVRLIQSFDRISDYEFAREDNIAKREALMRDLGLEDDVAALFASKQAAGSASKRKRETTHAAASDDAPHEHRKLTSEAPRHRSARRSKTDETLPDQSSSAGNDVEEDEGEGLPPPQEAADHEDQMDVDATSPLADHVQGMRSSPREVPTKTREATRGSSQAQRGPHVHREGAAIANACTSTSAGVDTRGSRDAEKGREELADAGGLRVDTSVASGGASGGHGGTAESKTGELRAGAIADDELLWRSRDSWEPWVTNAMNNVEKLSAGRIDVTTEEKWASVVRLWFKLEHAAGFKGTTPLSSKGRPKDLGEWIARARSASYVPKRPSARADVNDWICDYQEAMWAWWVDLNPPWRKGKKQDRLTKPRNHGDWSPLHHTGVNGLLTVLKGLKWFFEMEEKPKGSARWRVMLEDVEWALKGLLKQFGSNACEEPPQKRRRT